MAKKAKTIKLTTANANALKSALDKVEAHLAPVREVWAELLPAQKAALLAHSPLLARILALRDGWGA